jgi:hypothetical protein
MSETKRLVGTDPNQVPRNRDLGSMAYEDHENVIITGGVATLSALTATTSNTRQTTEISAVEPTLNLNFARSKTLDPRITFTRASEGRFYDGRTFAKAEENLLLRSQQLELWTNISGTTATANSTTAPDGTSTADTLTETTATSNHFAGNRAVSVTSGAQYAFSVFLKKGVGATAPNIFQVSWDGNPAGFATDVYANFDLNAGTVTQSGGGASSATITSVGNGWYRCSFIGTANATATSNSIGLIFCNNNATSTRAPSYAGATTSDVYVWGAQLEQRSSVTAYTPTTTAPVTNYIPVMQTAAANVARFDHSPLTGESLGLLIEEQRTNLLLRSAEFEDAAWTKVRSTITANAAIAPDGALAADALIEDTATGVHQAYGSSVSYVSGTAYTASVFAKPAAGMRFLQLNFASAVFGATNISNSAVFDLQNGAVTFGASFTASTAVITPVGNGFYRCSITLTATSTTSSTTAVLFSLRNAYSLDTATGYTGDGYSGIYIWGAQLEAGAFPTSYIPTVASQVTRQADAASMTGANFSSWYRQDEGTLFADFRHRGATSAIFAVNDNTGSNRMQLTTSSSAAVQFIQTSAGVQEVNILRGTYSENQRVLAAVAYKRDDFAVSQSGNAVGSDTSGAVPTVTQAQFGSRAGTVATMTGTIARLSYYPARLSNEELQEMTI